MASSVAGAAGVPGAGIYQQQQLSAEQAYNDAKAALEAKKNQTYQQFGFLPNGQVDPNNPTGMYQALRNTQAQELNTAEEDALGRGLGAHGLGAQVGNAPRFQQEVDSANLGRDYLGQISEIDQGLLGALRDKNDRLIAARQQQIQDAITQGMYGGGGGYGGAPGFNGGPGLENPDQFNVGGMSGEDVNAAAQQYAASHGYKYGKQVMQEGHIEVRNGVPGVMIKYVDSNGLSTTEWTPLPQQQAPQQQQQQTQGNNPANVPNVQGLPPGVTIPDVMDILAAYGRG